MTALSIRSADEPRFRVLRVNIWPDEDHPPDAWSRTFQKLQAWYADPSTVADDDIRPPSRATIRLAVRLCQLLRSKSAAAPTRTMASGEAGIVLEWVNGPTVSTWEIGVDQQVEISLYLAGKRQARSSIPFSPSEWDS